jgi:dienelactone hydrolase
MEYRWMSMGGEFNNVIGDVMDAIQFIRERAGELGLDFTRVGLAGGSAGGHLGAIAAQRKPECISFDGYNGLYDALDRDGSAFGGGDFTGTTEEEKKAASAIYQIKDSPPHTWLYHGTEDTTIVIEQSERFAAAITAAGGSAAVLAYEGMGHGFFNNTEPYLTLTTQALLAHTSYVFGLTTEAPQPGDYLPEPEQGLKPVGFKLPGAWAREGNPAETYTFRADLSVTSPSGESLDWFESQRNLFLVNGEGLSVQIHPLSRVRIRIGDIDYLLADGPTEITASGKGAVDAAASPTTAFVQNSQQAIALSDLTAGMDLEPGQTFGITGSMTLSESVYPNIWNDRVVMGLANPSGNWYPSVPNLSTTAFSLLARVSGAASPNAPVEIAREGAVLHSGTLGDAGTNASRQIGFAMNITLAENWEDGSAGAGSHSHGYELALDFNNDGVVDLQHSGTFLSYESSAILLGFGVIQGGNRGEAELLSNAWTFEVHDAAVSLLPDPSDPGLGFTIQPGGGLELSWFAESGFEYQLRTSHDLAEWTPYGSLHSGQDAVVVEPVTGPVFPVFFRLSIN